MLTRRVIGRVFSLRSLRAVHSVRLLSAPLFAFSIGFVGFGSVPRLAELVGGAIMLGGIALPSRAGLAKERQGRRNRREFAKDELLASPRRRE